MKWIKIFEDQDQAVAKVPLMQSISVRIGEHKICLSHTKSGFMAVSDACPHLGASMSKGHINIFDQIVCPWHSYRFSLANGIICSGQDCAPLHSYPIEWRQGALFIYIELAIKE